MPIAALVAKKAAEDLSEPDGDNARAKDRAMAQGQAGNAGKTDIRLDGNLKVKSKTKGAKDGGQTAVKAVKGGNAAGGGQRPPPRAGAR